MSIVAIAACAVYEPEAVRRAVQGMVAPLGGIGRFVRRGMRVLLKPNLLTVADLERAVTTHPVVVRAVAEIVQDAGGEVWIGDSPAGPVENGPQVWRTSGMTDVAAQVGARLVPFDGVAWKRLNGSDYFIARPVLEADLVINLPKLKTHALTLYTGAVKNLFGAIPGNRKRQIHYRAPGIQDFSQALVDVLELIRPELTILDGVLGQEGNGPGNGGTPRRYGLLAASTDSVALDAVMASAMGYHNGKVLHLAEAAARGLGTADPQMVQVTGDRGTLDFGPVRLPVAWPFFHIPSWMALPLRSVTRLRPRLTPSLCTRCRRCIEACPCGAIRLDPFPRFDQERCVGCLCCAEICPQGAIEPRQSLLARLVGTGR